MSRNHRFVIGGGGNRQDTHNNGQPLRAIARVTSSQGRESTGQGENPEGSIERFLNVARTQLQMDMALVGEMTRQDEIFRRVDGDGASFGVYVGDHVPLEATYCQRMLDHRIPAVIPDTRKEAGVQDLPGTSEREIGAYIGVPLEFSDGSVYGVLCCLSHREKPLLDERDVAFLSVISRLVADQLEKEHLEFENRRLESERASVQALLAALEARDDYTGEHSRTVVELSLAVAHRLWLDDEHCTEVAQVALLHDLGKIGVPDMILRKPGPLTDEEWHYMRRHPVIGARIIAASEALAHLSSAIRAEHERWDGAGYPDGLRGRQIPLASRIVLACDAFHAMTSDRPYRSAMSQEEAVDELTRSSGGQLDPAVVSALMQVVTEEAAEREASEATKQSTGRFKKETTDSRAAISTARSDQQSE